MFSVSHGAAGVRRQRDVGRPRRPARRGRARGATGCLRAGHAVGEGRQEGGQRLRRVPVLEGEGEVPAVRVPRLRRKV